MKTSMLIINNFLAIIEYTNVSKILHTLLVKHYNDSLDRQSSEWGRDEVTYFYVGAFLVLHTAAEM